MALRRPTLSTGAIISDSHGDVCEARDRCRTLGNGASATAVTTAPVSAAIRQCRRGVVLILGLRPDDRQPVQPRPRQIRLPQYREGKQRHAHTAPRFVTRPGLVDS